jgi:Putative DNA-binding domain
MPTLAEIQASFRRAPLDEAQEGALAGLVADGPARIAVHRNTLFASLTEVLRDTFPAVCRLVDERFFAYAAHEFIRRHPPGRAVLAEYGDAFADFLAQFPPCRELAYLADVARLEWLMRRAATAPDTAPLAAAALAGIAPEDTPRLRLELHPALGFLASPWPVDRIWRANRRGAEAPAASLDLRQGGILLEVSRQGGEVLMRPLDDALFAFRHALAQGLTLEQAASAALVADPAFDLSRTLAELFAEDTVAAISLAPSLPEVSP